MRYDYIDPFVGSTLRVLDQVIPGPARRGDIAMLRRDQIRGEVTVAITITGDSEGDVIISMDTQTALRVCSILTGSPAGGLTPEARDSLAELGNMIAGNAVSALNDLGFDFTVTPPEVAVNADTAALRGDREAMQIPLAAEWGQMTMNVLLGAD
jgi:CheY-specific phosphatase CheX